MNEWSTETTKAYTSCASLAALGVKVRAMKLFEPIRKPREDCSEDGQGRAHRQAV